MCAWFKAAAVLGALASLTISTIATAQAYPARPIRLIVPYPPGGSTDPTGRALAQWLSEKFGQTVVVDNRGGAGSTIGHALGAQANPDGYTLLLGTSGGLVVGPAYGTKVPYNPVKDFAPIGMAVDVPFMLTIHPAVPAKTVKDLIAMGKAQPGKINFGSPGSGTPNHLGMELLNALAGTKFVHVPYKGAGPALADLMGGQVQMLITGFSAALVHIKSGKLRALGVTGAQRVKAMPELPTIGETVPGYQMNSWYGLFAPAGTPLPIINRLQGEIAAMVKRQDMSDRFISLGLEADASTPQEFAVQINDEIGKWAKVIKLARVPQQ
jgi:tripartite-type tricarboxylate transporter receptor subunit TctC